MMKPALETISLGKGGVIQPKQHHSFLCSFLVQLQPWLLSPGPLQANPNHPISRNTVFLCSQEDRVDLSRAALHPLPDVQATPFFTWLHTSNPHFSGSSVPAACTGFSMKHDSAFLHTVPGTGTLSRTAFRVRSCLDCSSPPVPRKPGSFSPQVPMKPF